MWANLLCLFWLTLVPFTVRWLTESMFEPLATASFGAVLGFAGIGYHLTERALVDCNPGEPAADLRARLSIIGYAMAVPLAFVSRGLALAIYVGVIGIWLLPDHVIERRHKL